MTFHNNAWINPPSNFEYERQAEQQIAALMTNVSPEERGRCLRAFAEVVARELSYEDEGDPTGARGN